MNCRLGSFPNSTSLSCKFDGFFSVSAGQLYMFKGMPTVTIDKWLVTNVKDRSARGWLPPVFGVSPIFPFSICAAVQAVRPGREQKNSSRVVAESSSLSATREGS